MSAFTEPAMTINGVALTIAQAMTVRVALEAFAADLAERGLGDDAHGIAMTEGYLRAIRDIRVLEGIAPWVDADDYDTGDDE